MLYYRLHCYCSFCFSTTQLSSPNATILDADTASASSMVITIPEYSAGDNFSFPDYPGLEKQVDGQTVTYTGEQPLATYVDLLSSFTYENTEDEPEPGRRNVSIQVFSPGEGGSPLGSNIAEVSIEIVPVNDNSPVFDQALYGGAVTENAPLGSPVGVTVFASDRDVHSGTQISYEILGGSTDFTIDSVLGNITTLQPLDADSGDRLYQLTIIASDNGSPPRTSTVNVNIEVLDVNDNGPVFDQSNYSMSVPENVAVGSSVLQVFANDQDSTAINSEFLFRLGTLEQPEGSGTRLTPNEEAYLPFVVDPTSGIIYLNDSLDFEDTMAYSFTIIAEDTGLERSEPGVTQVFISVLDVNDNKPEFIGAPYSASILEDVALSTSVLQVIAIDADSTSNAEIEYQLEGTIVFDINSTSGLVFVAQPLDYEDSPFHSFTVIARDRGVDPMSSVAEILVDVLNVNDEPIVFEPYNFTISESSNAFEEQLSAFDRDGFNITYEPVSGFGDEFELDPSTGVLRSSPGFTFDYETQVQYNLVVRATDGNSSADASVTINVLDENDLPPRFDRDSYSFVLSENASVGTVFPQLSVTDGDTGLNSVSEFSIAAGNVGGAFTIDRTTGIISVASTVDFDTEPFVYTLVVLVRNVAPPFHNDSVIVFINITDVNDIQPMLSLEPLQVTFIENSSPVAVAASIEVLDADSSTHPLTVCRANLSRGPCGLEPNELALACGSSEDCVDRCAESISVDEAVAATFGLVVDSLEDASDTQILVITGDGSELAYQQVLRTLTYGNMAQEPLPGPRIIKVQCQDVLLASNSLQISVLVELVDEFCPMVSALLHSFEYVEGSDMLDLGQRAGLSISDQDRVPHDLLSQLQITLEDRIDGVHDVISVEPVENFGLSISIDAGENSMMEGSTIGERPIEMPNSLTVTISGVANISVYQQVLRTLSYTNSLSEPTLGMRRVLITPLSNSLGCTQIQLNMNVTLVNDNPPELVLNTTDTLLYPEESGYLLFAAEAGLQVMDLDHNGLFRIQAANVTLTGTADLGMEHLGFDPDLLPVRVSVDASSEGE